jgi:hypothetical protein
MVEAIAIAKSDMGLASKKLYPRTKVSVGIAKMPPPAPVRPRNIPTADPDSSVMSKFVMMGLQQIQGNSKVLNAVLFGFRESARP